MEIFKIDFLFISYKGLVWNQDPPASDRSIVANLIRLKLGRNRIVHLGIAATNNTFYKRIYKQLKKAMLDLGCSASELNELIPRPVRFKFTPSTARFANRDADISRLHAAVQQVKSTQGVCGVCLSGLSGIGKTQLVKRYFETHSTDFAHNIVWIDASDIEESFKQLAQILNLTIIDQTGNSKPISLIINEVHQYFWDDRTLFVFDNFLFPTPSSLPRASISRPESLKASDLLSFLPTYEDSISIITAQKEVSTQCLINIRLDSLSPTSALSYVTESLNLPRNNQQNNIPASHKIPQILEKLGYHPLAIQQFITYSQETKCHPSYYLDMLMKTPEVLLADEMEHSGVIDYIKITVNRIRGLSNQLPYRLLQIGAFLNGKEIKRGFFVRLLNENEETEDPDNTGRVNAALSILERFSLISIWKSTLGDCCEDVVTIHSLVQQTMSIVLKTNETTDQIYRSILAKIYQHNAKCQDDITFVDKLGYKYFNKQLIYLANTKDHCEDLFLAISKEHSAAIFNIFHNCQQLAIGQQILSKIEVYIKRSIENSKHSTHCYFLQSDSSINLKHLLYKVQSYIARIYYQKRNFFGAYLIFDSVRKEQKALLGKRHKDFLFSTLGYVSCVSYIRNIRNFVDFADDLEIAKKLYNINKRVFGEKHPHTLITKREVAIKFSFLNDRVSSLEMLMETLEAQIDIHGDSHAEVFATRQKIALRQIHKRIQPLQELLDDMLKSLPESNELVLRTKYFIGREYLTRGQYEKALKIFDVVYNGWLTLYGDSHSDVQEIEGFIVYLKEHRT